MQTKNIKIVYAVVYFLLSTIITWWFIHEGNLMYINTSSMILSCGIAGTKWGVQIIAAWLLLDEKKEEFIKRIGFVCFLGSCILLPFCISSLIQGIVFSFFITLIIAVLVMIFAYNKAVKKTQISTAWFWAWISCLAIAITLQIMLFFNEIVMR